MEVWIAGSEPGRAAELSALVGSLGHTPRRVLGCRDGVPEFADGGEPRRPDTIVAHAGGDGLPGVCRLLELHDGVAAPIVVSVEERHLARLPTMLADHELIVYPCTAAELGARIQRARIRFAGVGADEVVRTGSMTVDLATYSVTVGEDRIECSHLEFQLLSFLVTHPERVLSREALICGVWGYRYYGGSRTVDVHIRRLRAKLGPDAVRIKTVRGVGYRFAAA